MPSKKKATFRPGPKRSGSKSVSARAPKGGKHFSALGKERRQLQVLGLGSSDEKFMSFVEAHLALEYAEKIISAVEQPLIVLDENLKIISANRSFYDTFKVRPKAIKGQSFFKFGKGEWDVPKLRKSLKELTIKDIPVQDFEVKQGTPSAGGRTVHLTAKTIYTQAEKTRFILLGIKDVTGLKKAEKSASQLASFPQMNPMPTLELDSSGRVVYINPAARKLFPDLTKKGLEHPYLKGILSAVAELRASKKAWIQREVEAKGVWYAQTIIVFNSGSRIRIYAADVTELKKAEETIKSVARFPSENPSPILRVAKNGRILYGNTASQPLLRKWGTKVDRSVPENWSQIVAEAADSGVTRRVEVKVGTKTLSLMVVPVPETDYVNLYGRDITERIKMEKALLEAKDSLEVRVKERTAELERTRVDVEAERQRLYAVLETLPAYVVLLSEDYHVPFANRFFRERFGESYGKRCFEYLFHRTEPCENCETYKVLKTKAPHHWEWTGPDGRNYDIYDYPFKDTDGSSLILEMGIDITERKTAESELRRHKEHLEELVKERTADLENRNAQLAAEIAVRRKAEESLAQAKEEWERTFRSVPDLIAILDNQHTIVRVNQAMAQRLGKTPEECVSLHCYECVHGTAQPPDFCPHARTLRDGKEHVEEIHEERLGGDFLVSTTPMFDESGKMVGSVHVARDMTERKKAEEALRLSEEKYRTIVETAKEGIWIVDADRRTTYVNNRMAEMLGYRPDEMLGKSGLDFLDEEGRSLSDRNIEKRKLGIGEAYELKLIRKDGLPLWTIVNAVPLFDKNGKFTGTMSMLTDITERKKVDDALRETTEYLENLFNYANAPIICWDTESKITRFNHAFERLTDYKAEEVIGKDLSILFPADSKEESLGKIKQTLSGEYWEVVEIPILRKDGEVRIALWNSANLFAEDGKTIIATIAQGQDITERKKAEEALRVSLDRYRSYIEATGQLGWTTNADGEVREDIPSWRAYTGQSYEEILGWGWSKALHPDDLEHATQVWKKAVATKTLYEVEYRIRRHDGVYRHFMARGLPVLREGDSVREWVGTCVDITERKKAEEELRQSEERLRRAQEIAHLGSWELDLVNNRLSWSDEVYRIFGVEPREFAATYEAFLEAVHPDDRRAVDTAYSDSVSQGKDSYEIEHRIVRRTTGEIRIVHERCKHIRDEHGRIVRSVGMVHDITERKKAEEEMRALNEHLRQHEAELSASNKELEAFSYSVSHDLRAPLRNIDGFSQALLEDYIDKLDQKGQNYLRRVRAATQRMGQLIDDLLNLSVMVRKEMRREEVDLSLQVRAVAEELKNTAPERKVEIKIQDNLRASGDPLLLRQLLENLLGNAWKFTSKNPLPRIEFGSDERNGKKIFFVKDNGAGFDIKYVSKMFIPFQRLHSVEEFSGNGIGLAIVKRIVDRHGGRIWAEGEVEKGATFYFTFE